jgi:putative membrane protein
MAGLESRTVATNESGAAALGAARERSMAENKTELAEDRTDLAEDRTVLANERTFAGWLRTGFAAVGIGLGFQALFQMLEPAWIPKAIATFFLLIAIFIFWAAERRACHVLHRLHTHRIETVHVSNVRIMTIAAICATVALIAAMWLLKIKSGGAGA